MNIKDIIKEYYDKAKKSGWSYAHAARKLKEKYPDVEIGLGDIRLKMLELAGKKRGRGVNKGQRKPVVSSKETVQGEMSVEETSDAKHYNYKGEQSIQSKEQAVKFFNIDLSREEIYKTKYNAWDVTLKNKDGNDIKRTNYQVSIWTRIKTENFDYVAAREYLTLKLRDFDKQISKKVNGTGKGLIAISDLHIGAKTNKKKGVINTRDFDIGVLTNYMAECVRRINSLKKEEVVICILGDLVETITGLNHLNSWQELDENAHHGNAIIMAYEIISKFLSSINNLDSVYMVSGNHDRITSNKDEDSRGDVSLLVSYMLQRDFNVHYHPMINNVVYDGISYIMTHGHHRIIKRPMAKVILDYGSQKHYNVILSGHLHSRMSKRDHLSVDYVVEDSYNYRGIVVPPLFTGNFYSERNGWTSTPGFTYIESNEKKDNIDHFDFGL